MLKKGLLIGLLAVATPIFAKELTSFDAIINALSSGKQVTVVMQTDKCKITDPNQMKLPPSTVFHRIDTAIFTDDKMSFDGTKYSRGLPGFGTNGLIQRASFILDKTGHLNGVIATYDAVTNAKPDYRKDIGVDCHLGENARFYQN